MIPAERLELSRLSTHASKACVSAIPPDGQVKKSQTSGIPSPEFCYSAVRAGLHTLLQVNLLPGYAIYETGTNALLFKDTTPFTGYIASLIFSPLSISPVVGGRKRYVVAFISIEFIVDAFKGNIPL